MRCCARLRRAPATIFIARVIFCVALTLTIRLRMVLRLAIGGSALLLVRGLAESGPELLERLLEGRLGLLVDRLLRPDVLEDLGVLRVHEGHELTLVLGDLSDLEA